MSRCSRACLMALLLTALAGGAVRAGKHPDRPMEDTQRALGYLLASANEAIPRNSSCYGIYQAEAPPKIKDLLAMELASLAHGNNSVKGRCARTSPPQCSIEISHAYGEDVSSVDIKFSVIEGHARLESLECVLSP